MKPQPEPIPITFHLDLYRYWCEKRGSCAIPSRWDINPAEIPALLPYISIVQKVEEDFRFRLVGSAVVRQFGRELTGDVVGAHVSNAAEAQAALHSAGEMVIRTGRPFFATGQHESQFGAFHHVSTLLLPLLDGRAQAKMIIFTRIACFSSNAKASRDWLADKPFKLGAIDEIGSEEQLEHFCGVWYRSCHPPGQNGG